MIPFKGLFRVPHSPHSLLTNGKSLAGRVKELHLMLGAVYHLGVMLPCGHAEFALTGSLSSSLLRDIPYFVTFQECVQCKEMNPQTLNPKP